MPLQIRRGTNAERLTLTPSNGLVAGELIYVTDEQKLYIGTGLSGQHQGIVVTSFSTANAKDATAEAFASGTHNGIIYTYDANNYAISSRLDFDLIQTLLSQYDGALSAGTIKASVIADDSSVIIDSATGRIYGTVYGDLVGHVKGSVFADDSSTIIDGITRSIYGNLNGDVRGSVFGDDSAILIDGINSTINLHRTVGNHVIPTITDQYDLGVEETRFRNLYLSGNTIKLGTATISTIDGALNLPSGTTINGQNILTGSGLIDDPLPKLGANLDINTHNITGVGDISVNGAISNGTISLDGNDLFVANDYLNLSRANANSTVILRHNVSTSTLQYQVSAITTGSASCGNEIKTSRGSIIAPEAVLPNDSLSFTNIQYGHDGTNYVLSSGIAAYVDPEATVTTGSVPGGIVIATYSDGNNANPKGLVINSKGWLSVNKIGVPAKATLDINGFAKLAVLTSEPTGVEAGTIAVADGVTWDPSTLSGSIPYPVFYNGVSWIKMFS